MRVRRDRVNSGVITAACTTSASATAHNGTRVIVLAADFDIRVITEDGQTLRQLIPDRTRDYQRSAPARIRTA